MSCTTCEVTVEASWTKVLDTHNLLVAAHQKIGKEIERFRDWQSRVESWVDVLEATEITADYMPFACNDKLSELARDYDKYSVDYLTALVAKRDCDKGIKRCA